jgi:predicted MFS family arabinose efflux permease
MTDGPAVLSIADRGRRQPTATRIIFFVLGLTAGGWAPLVPFAKERLRLTDGGLGLLLLCLGAGSIVAMPLAGALAARFGCRRALMAALAMAVLAFPLMAIATPVGALAAALFLFGAALGSMDCVINMQAIIVERDRGRPMMSGFHALYSLGGVAGAGVVSGLVAVGAPAPVAALCVAAILLLAGAASWPGLLTRGSDQPGLAFAAPRGAVLVIGLFCLVVFLAEGSALDWSAVFLRAVRGAAPAQAGLAYVAFSATMTTGRLVGDRIVGRFGPLRTVACGSAFAAAGLAFAALAPGWIAGAAGYALVGAGCSNIVPVLFTLTGRQKAMPESAAVAAVSVFGYAGVLAGPAAIGLVASLSSLTIALLAVAALLAAVAAGATRLKALEPDGFARNRCEV